VIKYLLIHVDALAYETLHDHMLPTQLVRCLVACSDKVMLRMTHNALSTACFEAVPAIVPNRFLRVVLTLGQQSAKRGISVWMQNPLILERPVWEGFRLINDYGDGLGFIQALFEFFGKYIVIEPAPVIDLHLGFWLPRVIEDDAFRLIDELTLFH